MTNLLLVAGGILAIFAVSRHILRSRAAENSDRYDAAQLSEAIKALADLAEQLDNADAMLADLDACNPSNLLRGFRAQWCGIDGRRRHMDFLTDGRNGATAGLRQAAQEQRDRLNGEIIETVRAMSAALDAGLAPALHVHAVEKTVDGTTPRAAAGE